MDCVCFRIVEIFLNVFLDIEETTYSDFYATGRIRANYARLFQMSGFPYIPPRIPFSLGKFLRPRRISSAPFRLNKAPVKSFGSKLKCER